MQKPPSQVLEIAKQLENGQAPRRFRVRAILKWFGAKRRGDSIVAEIVSTLRAYGLQTKPELTEVSIDAPVSFHLISPHSPAIPDNQGDPNASNAPNAEEYTVDSQPSSIGPINGEPFSDQEEVMSADDEEGIDAKPDDQPVSSDSRDWTISSLRDKLERGQLTLQPHFQREYVWQLKPELPSRLIESLLLEIPIPPIYFGKVAEGRLEMIDGQQRLQTLVNFVINKFHLQKLQRMSSLNNKYFKDLSRQQQEKILDSPIRSIVIDAAGDIDLRYEIFERLNRGSMALNEQELRNCVYRGRFNELLAELEKDPYWRKVKGGLEPEARFKEREMILRFFAFAYRLPFYTGSLKRFLNDYMAMYAPKDDNGLKEHAQLFRQTMQNIYSVFGEHAARLYEVNSRTKRGAWDSKFSITTFDIQASALLRRQTNKVQKASEQIREQFLFSMLTDTELQDSISKRTGSSSQTKIRWERFRKLIDPILGDGVTEPRFFPYQYREDLWNGSHSCQLCKNEIHLFEDSTVDHILPYSKGGKTARENGQLAHRGCNAVKNSQIAGNVDLANPD